MRRLKLIWDFRGIDALKIAKHHNIHLKEFLLAKQLTNTLTGIETINELHSIAFLVVNENEMPPVRDALKPHRGQLYTK